MATAKKVMTSIAKLVVFNPRTTANEAMRELLEHRISGGPVVGPDGQLLGIVSESQLLAVLHDVQFGCSRVETFMCRDVITIDESTPIKEIAKAFVTHRVRRLPVVGHGRLVGQVTRSDLFRFALHKKSKQPFFLGLIDHAVPMNLAGMLS